MPEAAWPASPEAPQVGWGPRAWVMLHQDPAGAGSFHRRACFSGWNRGGPQTRPPGNLAEGGKRRASLSPGSRKLWLPELQPRDSQACGERLALCDFTGAVCSLASGFPKNTAAFGDSLARRRRPRLHRALPPFVFQIPSSRCPSW